MYARQRVHVVRPGFRSRRQTAPRAVSRPTFHLHALLLFSALLLIAAALMPAAHAAGGPALDARKARVVEHWNAQRRAEAIPRDIHVDARGQGYLRRLDGTLVPYGRQVAAGAGRAADKPTGHGGQTNIRDTTPPAITDLYPSAGATIGSARRFSATITDASGLKSVAFFIRHPDGSVEKVSPSQTAANYWSIDLQGFSDGDWSWWVVARDAARGHNAASSATLPFTVVTDGGSGGTVTNAHWSFGGTVQTAAGRLYFQMPANATRTLWTSYLCSGTAVSDATSGRSIILTAAHCVYDDANKAFARNVLFIPDQDGTRSGRTDLTCTNDPLGCWVPSFGVVDTNWAQRTFPDNVAWDYAFYVVSDSGAHQGTNAPAALDLAAGALPVNFATPYVDDGVPGAGSVDFTHALGYSYSDDPHFMYCAEDMTTVRTDDWWLPSCGLSGGSSGGAWVQPMDVASGSGPIISVTSWHYLNRPGMAGPKLSGSSAECVFATAKGTHWSAVPTTDGDAGVAQVCP